MKKLIIVTCACLFFVACASSASGNATDELHVRVRLTYGERNRSGGSMETITVERDAIVWEKMFRRTRSLPKEFKLSPADKRNLLKLIGANNLLVTDSLELPRDPSYHRYFFIEVDLTLGEKKGSINIHGPRNAVQVKEKKLYQNTLILVKELYRIMNRQDKSVLFAELILGP